MSFISKSTTSNFFSALKEHQRDPATPDKRIEGSLTIKRAQDEYVASRQGSIEEEMDQAKLALKQFESAVDLAEDNRKSLEEELGNAGLTEAGISASILTPQALKGELEAKMVEIDTHIGTDKELMEQGLAAHEIGGSLDGGLTSSRIARLSQRITQEDVAPTNETSNGKLFSSEPQFAGDFDFTAIDALATLKGVGSSGELVQKRNRVIAQYESLRAELVSAQEGTLKGAVQRKREAIVKSKRAHTAAKNKVTKDLRFEAGQVEGYSARYKYLSAEKCLLEKLSGLDLSSDDGQNAIVHTAEVSKAALVSALKTETAEVYVRLKLFQAYADYITKNDTGTSEEKVAQKLISIAQALSLEDILLRPNETEFNAANIIPVIHQVQNLVRGDGFTSSIVTNETVKAQLDHMAQLLLNDFQGNGWIHRDITRNGIHKLDPSLLKKESSPLEIGADGQIRGELGEKIARSSFIVKKGSASAIQEHLVERLRSFSESDKAIIDQLTPISEHTCLGKTNYAKRLVVNLCPLGSAVILDEGTSTDALLTGIENGSLLREIAKADQEVEDAKNALDLKERQMHDRLDHTMMSLGVEPLDATATLADKLEMIREKVLVDVAPLQSRIATLESQRASIADQVENLGLSDTFESQANSNRIFYATLTKQADAKHQELLKALKNNKANQQENKVFTKEAKDAIDLRKGTIVHAEKALEAFTKNNKNIERDIEAQAQYERDLAQLKGDLEHKKMLLLQDETTLQACVTRQIDLQGEHQGILADSLSLAGIKAKLADDVAKIYATHNYLVVALNNLLKRAQAGEISYAELKSFETRLESLVLKAAGISQELADSIRASLAQAKAEIVSGVRLVLFNEIDEGRADAASLAGLEVKYGRTLKLEEKRTQAEAEVVKFKNLEKKKALERRNLLVAACEDQIDESQRELAELKRSLQAIPPQMSSSETVDAHIEEIEGRASLNTAALRKSMEKKWTLETEIRQLEGRIEELKANMKRIEAEYQANLRANEKSYTEATQVALKGINGVELVSSLLLGSAAQVAARAPVRADRVKHLASQLKVAEKVLAETDLEASRQVLALERSTVENRSVANFLTAQERVPAIIDSIRALQEDIAFVDTEGDSVEHTESAAFVSHLIQERIANLAQSDALDLSKSFGLIPFDQIIPQIISVEKEENFFGEFSDLEIAQFVLEVVHSLQAQQAPEYNQVREERIANLNDLVDQKKKRMHELMLASQGLVSQAEEIKAEEEAQLSVIEGLDNHRQNCQDLLNLIESFDGITRVRHAVIKHNAQVGLYQAAINQQQKEIKATAAGIRAQIEGFKAQEQSLEEEQKKIEVDLRAQSAQLGVTDEATLAKRRNLEAALKAKSGQIQKITALRLTLLKVKDWAEAKGTGMIAKLRARIEKISANHLNLKLQEGRIEKIVSNARKLDIEIDLDAGDEKIKAAVDHALEKAQTQLEEGQAALTRVRNKLVVIELKLKPIADEATEVKTEVLKHKKAIAEQKTELVELRARQKAIVEQKTELVEVRARHFQFAFELLGMPLAAKSARRHFCKDLIPRVRFSLPTTGE